MPKIRIQRLQSELLRLISTVVASELRDPHFDSVSFTEVILSPDMSFLKIYFSIFDEEQANIDEIVKRLNRSTGFVKSAIADAHVMRTIPDIRFNYDSTNERVSRLDQLLDQIQHEREERESQDNG